MPRIPVLSYDRGTLILHPPPRGKGWIEYATWDDRVDKFRIPAIAYRDLLQSLHQDGTVFEDQTQTFAQLHLISRVQMEPYPHQQEALQSWIHHQHRGVVVLPTAAGKTYLAQLAMQATQRETLIVVPTLDLMHQWYAQLVAAFPDLEVGLLGGGSRDRSPILVATYDSAAIQAEALGNRYALLIFDECHHLPSDFNRAIAELNLAPFRLGLTATPERSDGRHADLITLIGAEVYRKSAEELSGNTLARYEVIQIRVQLSQQERDRYNVLIQQRNAFLRSANIRLGSLEGWQAFVQQSSRSSQGRRAMMAHRDARAIALGTEGKIRLLTDLLAKHYPERVLIFTNDNATVYRISQDFLIPAITHQTPVKERHAILERFRAGTYQTVVTSHVLNEGVDVPDARVAIILSGTGSSREYVQRLGRILRKGKTANKQAILYEVIAEDTSEEYTSQRRRESPHVTSPTSSHSQLSLVPPPHLYAVPAQPLRRAAEAKSTSKDANATQYTVEQNTTLDDPGGEA